MARTYKRDSNGRFAGGGGSSGGRNRPAAKPAPRGTNRLTRDNAGKITSVGGNGATARGGRLRTAAGNQRATQTARIKGSPSGVMKGRVARNPGAGAKLAVGKSKATSKPPLTPSQVAGARRRASERPEAFLARAQGRTNQRLQALQDQKSSLETSLRRRRGKLDEAGKKAASKKLSKTNRQIERVKDAQSRYRQDLNVANMNRNLTMNYRTGKKAPQNEKTTRNRLGTLRRRVLFLKKDEIKPADKYGSEYDGPRLSAAKKALNAQATTGMRGLRVTNRSKPQAAGAQRKRRSLVIKQANTGRRTSQGTKPGLYTERVRRGVSRQGNLLTGGVDRVAGRRFQPVRSRRK